MRLSDKAIQWLHLNRATRTKIAIALEAHPATVDRWVVQNNRNLTNYSALQIIKSDSQLGMDELLQNDER